jgi:hypothetical protein
MKYRRKSIAALGVSGLAGLLVASLALAGSPSIVGPGHDHAGAIPSDASQSAFYSEMAKVNARMHEGMNIAPCGDIDQDFMRMMIPHHQGAVDMALVLLKYGRDEKLKRLAQSIVVEQAQEIAYMRSFSLPCAAKTSSINRIADH